MHCFSNLYVHLREIVHPQYSNSWNSWVLLVRKQLCIIKILVFISRKDRIKLYFFQHVHLCQIVHPQYSISWNRWALLVRKQLCIIKILVSILRKDCVKLCFISDRDRDYPPGLKEASL